LFCKSFVIAALWWWTSAIQMLFALTQPIIFACQSCKQIFILRKSHALLMSPIDCVLSLYLHGWSQKLMGPFPSCCSRKFPLNVHELFEIWNPPKVSLHSMSIFLHLWSQLFSTKVSVNWLCLLTKLENEWRS